VGKEARRVGTDQGPLPWDQRAIVFQRAIGAAQINPVVAASAVGFVNIALSTVLYTGTCTHGGIWDFELRRPVDNR